MYFPILTAKQNEVFALSELPASVFNNTIPVLIPPNIKSLKAQIRRLVEKNIYFILVVNPQKNNYPKKDDIAIELIDDVLKNYSNYSLGFIITDKTTEHEVKDFFSSYPQIEKSLIHYNKFYNTSLLKKISNSKFDIYLYKNVEDKYIEQTAKGEIVLIEDGFKKKDRNTDYPAHSDFSNFIYDYKNKKAFGFGDYTIIGKEVSDGGGSPYAIALHLSNIDSVSFNIYHFLSDDNLDQKNQAKKFTQALEKLIDFINTYPCFEGEGIKDFRDRYLDGHYPGLGVCKKMSIKNHIEQVSNYLNQ